MIKLQSRDVEIMLGLRFGIVSEDDLIDEIFKATLIDEAPEEFQEFNANRSLSVKREAAANNEQLWVTIQQVFKTSDGQNSDLREDLIQVAHKEGKHLGSRFAAKVELLELPIQLIKVRSILKGSVDLQDKEQNFKNKKQVCRKVMKRLIGAKVAKRLDKLSRGGNKRYYHLTKDGKALVQEYMHELCMPEHDVVVHNWHVMHAEHDSMVSQVGKTIFSLARKQDYEVLSFLTEAQVKGESLRWQDEYFKRWGIRRSGLKYYPDLVVSLYFTAQEKQFLIEIDNATQPVKKVFGKVQSKMLMLIICVNDDRIKKLVQGFKLLGCTAEIYFTTINAFKAGGVFDSNYWDFQRGRLIKLSNPIKDEQLN